MKTANIDVRPIFGTSHHYFLVSHGQKTIVNISDTCGPSRMVARSLRAAAMCGQGFTHYKINGGQRQKLPAAPYWFGVYDARGTYLYRCADPESFLADGCPGYKLKVRRVDEAQTYPVDWIDPDGEPFTNSGQTRIFEKAGV